MHNIQTYLIINKYRNLLFFINYNTGNYTNTNVNLRGNLLTRFEEGAFKSMLQDMSAGGRRFFLDVTQSILNYYNHNISDG